MPTDTDKTVHGMSPDRAAELLERRDTPAIAREIAARLQPIPVARPATADTPPRTLVLFKADVGGWYEGVVTDVADGLIMIDGGRAGLWRIHPGVGRVMLLPEGGE